MFMKESLSHVHQHQSGLPLTNLLHTTGHSPCLKADLQKLSTSFFPG